MQKLLLLFSWLYRRKSSWTGLEIQKWKVTDEYISKAILNFALDCFILQIIYLPSTHKNFLLHYQLVRLIKCVLGRHVPCRISMFMDWKKHTTLPVDIFWTDGRSVAAVAILFPDIRFIWTLNFSLKSIMFICNMPLAEIPWGPILPAGIAFCWVRTAYYQQTKTSQFSMQLKGR